MFNSERATRNGLRVYGEWAGNPKGRLEDVTRCIAGVYGASQWIESQCSRKRGYGPDGLYCKQHNPKKESIGGSRNQAGD